MNDMKVNILVQCSDYYSIFCGVMLTSLYEQNKHFKEINVYILDDNISKQNKYKLINNSEKYSRTIHFISTQGINDFLCDIGATKYHGSYTTLYKLFAISRISEKIDKLLYLDSDMLITSKLDDLISENLEGYLCGMIPHTTAYQYKKHIGFNDFETWYNGGLVLFNVNMWKDINAEKTVIDTFTKPDVTFSLADEDSLNILFHDKIKKLALKFNYPSTYDTLGFSIAQYVYDLSDEQINEFIQAKNDVVIYHCFTIYGKRPWDNGCEAIETSLWRENLKYSEWSDYELQNKPFSLTFTIEHFLHNILPSGLYAKVHKIMYHRFLNNSAKSFSYIRHE